MAKGDEITTKFKVDISDLKKGIADANQQIKLANAEFKAATAGMDDWAKSAEGIKAKLDQLDSVLAAQKSKLEAYTEQLKRQETAYSENGRRIEELKSKLEEMANNGISKASDEYKKYENALAACEKEQESNKKSIDDLKVTVLNQQAAVNKTEAEIKKYGDTLNDTEKETKELDTAVDDLGKSAEESSGGFTVLKGALADLVSAGIQAAINALKDLAASVVEAQKEYDAGADAIIAATGATGEAAEELITVYENVAGSVIGSFDEIGAAVGEVNTRFGVTGDDLQALTEKFLKFAELNGTDVKSSIDSVQTAMAAFGVDTKDTGAMLDLLNKAGQDTGVSVEQLAQQLAANSTALREMGMSVSDSTMFLANLSKNGVDASAVIAGLKKALAEATAEGKPMSQAMDEIEKSIKNAKTSTDAMQIACELFGNKAGPAIAMAVREGRLSFEELGLTLDDFKGNIDETYNNMQDGSDKVALAMQKLKLEAAKVFDAFLQEHGPQLEKLLNEFTTNVLPAIKKALETVLDAVSNIIDIGAEFIDWLNSGSTGAEAFKAVVIGLVAAFATMSIIQTVVGLINSLQTAFVALNAVMAANPIGLVVTAIAALVAAFAYLWNTSEEFRNFWIGLWDKIKEVASAAWEAITGFFTAAWEKIKEVWEPVKEWFAEKWEGIKSAFADVGDWFKEKFEGARNWVNQAFEDVGTWFGDRWNDIQNAWANVGDWFNEKMTSARNWLNQAFQDVGTWFGERRKDVENAWTGIDKWMGDNFGSAWDAIKKAFSPFVDYFKMIWENVKLIYSAVESVLKGDFEGAWNAIKGVWDNVKGYFKGIWDGIVEIFDVAKKWFGEKFSSAWEAIKEAFSPITKWFSDAWAGIQKVFSGAAQWFGNVFDKVGQAIKAPLNAVIRGMNFVIRGLNKISIDIPDWVPGVGGKTFGFNIGEIPELARGGVLRKGQVGLLEGRGDEAVVPLEKNKGWIRAVANDLLEALGSSAGGNSISNLANNKNMTFTQNIYAPKQPSRIELYRQTRNLLAFASMGGVKTV